MLGFEPSDDFEPLTLQGWEFCMVAGFHLPCFFRPAPSLQLLGVPAELWVPEEWAVIRTILSSLETCFGLSLAQSNILPRVRRRQRSDARGQTPRGQTPEVRRQRSDAMPSTADIELIMEYLDALAVPNVESAMVAARHVAEHSARQPELRAERCLRLIGGVLPGCLQS